MRGPNTVGPNQAGNVLALGGSGTGDGAPGAVEIAVDQPGASGSTPHGAAQGVASFGWFGGALGAGGGPAAVLGGALAVNRTAVTIGGYG